MNEPKTYYMDGYLKSNLTIAKDIIQKDWDMVFAVDGEEGGGKSVLTMQMAYFLDPTLTLDRITFSPTEFQTAIEKADKYQAVIYDEGFTGLSSRATMSMINRTLIQMFAEIRHRNLYVFVVMPTFFDLDKYVALWRSRALLHVYTSKNFERGYFGFYNKDTKKDLYINGKKFYSYAKPRPNFHGRFYNTYVVDEAEYRKKKYESDMQQSKEMNLAEEKSISRLKAALMVLNENISCRDIQSALAKYGVDLTYGRISQLIREHKRENSNIEVSEIVK